ncbi:GntR family transcriptional regulator [Falsirhodobacter sp. alg1]|uniref:GntR family transcriptional regulator n=2 Tax=Falsirhodobacter sp. alg1 TaxID=1472418 RepID=UPI0005EFA8F3|nr:GntR family transcriptional regulator [Falsirhodobacter sp. alg1]
MEEGVRQRRPRRLGALTLATMSRAEQPRTATLIYRELYDDIVNLRRPPNTPLPERDLSAHFGVSRTPLREALLRLADEGLVVIYPQVGTFVARIPVRVLYESIRIRRALEVVMVQEAAMKMDRQTTASLDENMTLINAARADGNNLEFHRLDNDFHRIIRDFSGLRTFISTVDTVRAQIDRYRLTTLPQPGRLARVIEEHVTIRDGLVARDAAAAAQALEMHLGQMLTEIEMAGNNNPEYFLDDREGETP